MAFIIRGFLAAAVVYGLAALAFGLMMAISKDHGQHVTHGHINLIGLVSFFLFAVYYKVFGPDRPSLFARLHFWTAQVSALGIFIGLALIYSGQPQFDPLAAVSSLLYAASFLIFAVEVLRNLGRVEAITPAGLTGA